MYPIVFWNYICIWTQDVIPVWENLLRVLCSQSQAGRLALTGRKKPVILPTCPALTLRSNNAGLKSAAEKRPNFSSLFPHDFDIGFKGI